MRISVLAGLNGIFGRLGQCSISLQPESSQSTFKVCSSRQRSSEKRFSPVYFSSSSFATNVSAVFSVVLLIKRWSFRLLAVRLRLELIRLRLICQFAYDSYVEV